MLDTSYKENKFVMERKSKDIYWCFYCRKCYL